MHQRSSSERHLSPAEAGRKRGVSRKTLRLYERHGLLVAPLRAENGWRAYGPAEMARLHQVLALEALGLPHRPGDLEKLKDGLSPTLDAMDDPQASGKLPIDRPLYDFIGKAITALKAKGG